MWCGHTDQVTGVGYGITTPTPKKQEKMPNIFGLCIGLLSNFLYSCVTVWFLSVASDPSSTTNADKSSYVDEQSEVLQELQLQSVGMILTSFWMLKTLMSRTVFQILTLCEDCISDFHFGWGGVLFGC